MGLASGKVKVKFGSAMNCKNARLEGEMIRFDCPSCGLDADLDEAALDEYWLNYQGLVTCPVPQGCNTQYTIPTKTELDVLRAATAAAAMGVMSEIESAPAKSGVETEPAESTAEAEESEAEPEPEKPKFTGPFRYESKSDKEDSNDDEFDQVVARNREQKTKPQSPLAIRTFRRIDCIHQGKDCFDDTVSEFLGEIGKENIISVTPVTYMEKIDKCADYGVVIYYNTPESMLSKTGDEADAAPSEPVVWRD